MKNRKQQIKEKQNRKKEDKLLRELIVQKYINELEVYLNEGYYKMNTLIEELNQQLMESAIKYGDIKKEIEIILHESEGRDITDKEQERFNSLMKKAFNFEKENLKLYKGLVERDEESKAVIFSQEIIDSTLKVIDKAERELDGLKNSAYMTSLIRSRSYRKIDEYNDYILEVADSSNDYIEAHLDARDDFIEFLKAVLKKNEDTIINEENKKEIEESTKYRQRLRVEYYQLENFLKYKGFECNRQNSTTHAIWKNKETGISVPLPNKSRTVPQGTVSKLLRAINSNRNELAEFIYK